MHKRAKRTMGGRKTMTVRCDVCQKGQVAAIIVMGGEEVAVCNRCREIEKVEERFSSVVSKAGTVEEITGGFGKRIREAREKAGMSHAELARRISEKASYVEKLEKEKFEPTISVARKMEKALGIKIITKGT